MPLSVLDTGIVYRNPAPHLHSRQALHPTVAVLQEDHFVAAFDVGEAVESLDYRTWVSRSRDGGKSWEAPRPLVAPDASRPSNDLVRISRLPDGTLLGFGARLDRPDLREGVVNRANLGYAAMELFTIRSRDGGQSWTPPAFFPAPLVGPSFEICHPVVTLADGRCLAPTSTWRGWNGDCPSGMQAIALVSYDQGMTWPDWLPVANQWPAGIISWEIGLGQLPDQRLVATVWSFAEGPGRSLPSQFTVTSPGTSQFLPLRPTGFCGETAKLCCLRDGRILCLYRGLDRPGLWASLAEIVDGQWVQQEELAVWKGMSGTLAGMAGAADELSQLKLGSPNLVQLSSGDVLALFWCLEAELRIIRWVRMGIPPR